jgi:hypothetical protein
VTRLDQISEAAETLLRDGDVLVNEIAPIPGAKPNQTVSDHDAEEAAAGRTWAVWLCAFLSWAVEKDHCAATRRGDPTPWTVYPRALLWFAILLPISPIWLPLLFLIAHMYDRILSRSPT